MRVSLQWLRELVQTDPEALEPQRLADRLSIAGFEVEEIEDLAARADGVVVGLVRQREPHPAADKLSVCTVDVGAAETLQIVCGASNVRAGIHVPVALVGATLPAVGLTIKPAELRGVASSGMICSLTELGISGGVDGIAILDELGLPLPPLGSPVGPLLGLDDQVLELAITANRPDGLSMLGIAREVAALSGGTVLAPEVPAHAEATPLAAGQDDLRRMEAGGLFSLTALNEVRVGPSPSWLRQRLERAGVRSINSVVDITNLVMLETGQPLHAFDRDRLARAAGVDNPSAIGLRQARPGERLTTLDGVERTLDSEALVVTYADRAIALAGVMGGLEDAVTDSTSRILLEAAVFAPAAVRRSSRSVGLRSEASSRFEKGLPAEATLAASDRAVALLRELAGAQPEGRWLHRADVRASEPLQLRRDALHNLLGPVVVDGEEEDLEDERIEATLSALGCSLDPTDDGWAVTVPPSRGRDLCREVDLIEEVARLVGYDRFASHLPDPLEPGGADPAQRLERRLRQALCAAGLQETVSFSLTTAAEGRVPLANPLLADYGHLRDTLHEDLLQAARRNLQASAPGFWAFEIGRVFSEDSAGIAERPLLAGVICAERRSELWSSSGKPRCPDYHEARGILQAALESLMVPVADRVPAPGDTPADLLHPGRSALLIVEGRPAGWFGQLHPRLAESLELPEATHVFELNLQALLTAATRPARLQPAFRPYPTVPASERDLALVVQRSVQAQDLLTAIRKAGKPLLEAADLVDRYEGAQVAEGHCSQAFRLRYRDASRTLTDADVEAAHDKVRRALERQFGAQLRS